MTKQYEFAITLFAFNQVLEIIDVSENKATGGLMELDI